MAGRLDGKCAIITGAASGIGAATARRFHAEGARLVLPDLTEEGRAAVAKELGGAGHRRLDVADAEQVTAVYEDAARRLGRLDVVFNNAGIGSYAKTPDIDPAIWHQIIAVDLRSV